MMKKNVFVNCLFHQTRIKELISKRCLLLGIVVCMYLPAIAQKKSGISSSSDMRLGYSEKVFTVAFNYDLGYKWKDMLYLGVGPVASYSTGNDNSSASGGGYAKLRFIAPLKTKIRPFVEGRTGYSYNFKVKKGGMEYGAGAGIKYNNTYFGAYVDISSTTTKETVTGGYWRYTRKDVTGKTKSTREWVSITSTNEHTKWNYTPFLLIGFEF